MRGTFMGSRQEPETSVFESGVIDGDPDADQVLDRLHVQKRRVLMSRHFASNARLL